MPAVENGDHVIRIQGLNRDSAAQWASRALELHATKAVMKPGRYGMELTVEFPGAVNGGGTLNLIKQLRFAAEVEGLSPVDLVQKAVDRDEEQDVRRRILDED